MSCGVYPHEPKNMSLGGDVVKLTMPLPSGGSSDQQQQDGNKQALPSAIILKGRNVSGRTWKVRPQKRASTLRLTRANNQVKSWEQRQAEKNAKKLALELQSELREERRLSKVRRKERRLEHEKRRAENEFKSQQQSAKTLNHDKVGYTLKALSKKQLRQIKKTRVNTKTGVVEYVSAYAK